MSIARQTEIAEGLIGKYGGEVIADTNAHTGTWSIISAAEDSVIATLTGNITGATTVTLNVGGVIYGVFTGITLTSGSVIAYDKI